MNSAIPSLGFVWAWHLEGHFGRSAVLALSGLGTNKGKQHNCHKPLATFCHSHRPQLSYDAATDFHKSYPEKLQGMFNFYLPTLFAPDVNEPWSKLLVHIIILFFEVSDTQRAE